MVLKLEEAKRAVDLGASLAAVRLRIDRCSLAKSVSLTIMSKDGLQDNILSWAGLESTMAADIHAIVMRRLRAREAEIIRQMHQINMEIPE